MYKNKELRHFQYFVAPDWTGGVYASPTIAGSRPGAIIASCWAALMYMGEEGYVNSTKQIIGTARKISSELSKIQGIKVFGDPKVSVVGFGSDLFDIYRLGDQLTKKGWNLNSLQFPPSIHICCTYLTEKVADELISEVTRIAKELSLDPHAKPEGQAAIYGLAQAIPDRSMVGLVAKGFIDCLYVL